MLLCYPFEPGSVIDYQTGEVMTIQYAREQGFTLITDIESACLWGIEYHVAETAMSLTRAYNVANRTHLDWHEFSSALDHLHSMELIKVIGHTDDGMTIYGKEPK